MQEVIRQAVVGELTMSSSKYNVLMHVTGKAWLRALPGFKSLIREKGVTDQDYRLVHAWGNKDSL